MACLIDIGVAIVTKLSEYTVEPAIRQVGYVICYNNNLKELETQIDELGCARDSIEHAVETEERNGKKREAEVQNWLTEVVRLTKAADGLKAKHLAQTKCLFCPNLKLRHRLSRRSTKLVLEVAKLHEKKKNLSIAYVARLEELCAVAIQDYEAFDSRTSAAKDVINQLRNSNTYMTGVYGIGGVGKTTLVKEVYNQLAASGEKLFDEVVMVLDLKQNPSIERIQKAIAEKLGLELPESGTPDGRARLISNRIKEKKTFVILDDVWESIDLEGVGLPRMATLKILLTSRSKLVLSSKIGTQKEFHLKALNKEDTWRLFQKMAGDIVEKPDIRTIATQVAEKCGGLPLLIVTVARSLKDSPLYDWKDTLRRLKKLDGKGLTDKTYSAIQWSYDKLDNELKSVFLLCASEVGSANSVYVLDLLKYSMGLGFIKDVETMEEARDALNSLLKKLQHSCLLLDTEDNQWVRIHDLVKHVATHIAAKDHHVLSASHGRELKEWPNKEFSEKCFRISLMDCQTPQLPEVLHCPELTMFHLSSVDVDAREIPGSFFKETKKLKVLDLTRRSITLLPPSLKCLQELQTLCLDQCTILGDLALVGELHNLKILSLIYSMFKQLPDEIGKLTRLQLMDLTGCSQLEVISPDVISKLNRLEELRMGKNSFNKWEYGKVADTNRSNASLEELRSLPRLTTLQMHVPDASMLPTNLFTTLKLERFQICIGSMWKWDDVDEALSALKLHFTTNNELDQGLKLLLKRTHDLYVEGMEGVNDKFFHELATGGFQQLKHLHVQNNAKFAYTINAKVEFPNLKKLSLNGLGKLTTVWNNQLCPLSPELETIEILSCDNLKSIFPASVAESLQRLRSLDVRDCGVEEIISKEDEVQIKPTFVFSQLTYVRLQNLPQLSSFYPGSHSTEWPSILSLWVYRCPKVQIFAKAIPPIRELKNPCTQDKQSLFLLEKGSFSNVENLGLRIMEDWDSPPLHSFRNLKELLIYAHANSSVRSLENLLGLEEVNEEEIHAIGDGTLPHLRQFGLFGLRKLMNLGDSSSRPSGLYIPRLEILEVEDCDSLKNLRSSAISFNKLTTLQVSRCKGLKYLISFSMAKSLMQLTTLEVNDCDEMIEIVESSGIENSGGHEVEFKALKHLKLSALPSLRGLCSETHIVKFPSLEKLSMISCTQLEGFIFDPTDIGALADSNVSTDTRVVQRFLFDNKVEFPKLTSLSLKGLTKLTTIWNEPIQDTSAPTQPKSFDCENLEHVEIDSCESLKYIFPLSVARNLRQLQRLVVKNCGGVKEIVARGEGLQTIVFPKVTTMHFGKLSQLITFYPGMHICSWPLLTDLEVYGCNKVDIAFAEKHSSSHEKLEAESSTNLVDRQSFFSIDKDSFPNLERLSVDAMEFPNGPLPAVAQLFGKLKKLDLYCPESKSLVFLDKLLDTASPSPLLQLPRLKELRLVGMEKLMHLGQDDEDDNSQSATRIPNIPNLQILSVNGCHNLRNLRSSAISFNSLTTLEVSVCYRLKYLVTYSMANSLMQLTTLEVNGCLRLVQIVGSNDDDESRKDITFPRLKHLKLSRLPRLQRFCSGNCIAKFPSLETSSMSNRLKLKIFAADNQTLQLTNEAEDTDVDRAEEWLAADDESYSASTI